jgi:hypothetical protein
MHPRYRKGIGAVIRRNIRDGYMEHGGGWKSPEVQEQVRVSLRGLLAVLGHPPPAQPPRPPA